MPARRVIHWPGDPAWITDATNGPANIQKWLVAHAPLLAAVKINPTPTLLRLAGALETIEGQRVVYSPGMWITRCAANYQVSPWPGLLRLQIEQDLLSPDQPLEGFTVTRMPEGFQVPPEYRPPRGPIGERYLMDTHEGRPGIVRINGDRRLACACGFGIPDPGRRAPWSLTAYGDAKIPIFGPEAQLWAFFWYLRRQVTKFEVGLPPENKPQRVRMLYPSDAERALAIREGREPRCEEVECGDFACYWGAGYTPYEPGFETIEKMRLRYAALGAGA